MDEFSKSTQKLIDTWFMASPRDEGLDKRTTLSLPLLFSVS